MTTVKDVPRSLLELCYRAINGGDCQLSGMEHGQAFRELKALLDAPAQANDREAFEESYARHFSRATGRAAKAADIKAMREGENYGGARAYLNGQWAGWKARGAPQKYDDTLLPFLAHMRAELHANSHKGDREGWLRMTLEQALDEIRHHTDKLIVPVMNQDREAIREHAADVANCAMMLADIAGVLSRE